ncbi:hypothetical protein IP88_05155 [alpha proteobacterium AAP81b]|nr:hypothetical protein IP88_05155 [alpha proteobacterium AAP81b]
MIGACVAVEGAAWLGGAGFGDRLALNFGLIPARLTAALAGHSDPAGAALTLVSHMFLHAGLFHLGLNLLFLGWVGRYVEWVAGWRSLLLLFLAGGIVGGLAQWLVAPAATAPIVGASGAIAAVFGAYVVIFAQHRARARRVLGLSLSGDTLSSLWLAATWIGLQLLTGLVFNTAGGGGIAIWTHIGGFLTGLLVANVWRHPRL